MSPAVLRDILFDSYTFIPYSSARPAIHPPVWLREVFSRIAYINQTEILEQNRSLLLDVEKLGPVVV